MSLKMFSILFISLSIVTIGCSQKHVTHKNANYNPLKLQCNLYGLLNKSKSGYIFSSYATDLSSIDRKKAWVDFTTGMPLWNTKEGLCDKGYNLGLSPIGTECDRIDDELFMVSHFSFGWEAFRVICSPLFLGIPLFASTYNIQFNEQEYNTAYAQAMSRLDKSVLKDIDNTLSTLENEYKLRKINYDKAIKSADIKIQINDQSGFYNMGNVNFRNLIYLKPNMLSNIPAYEDNGLSELLNKIQKTNPRREWQEQTESVSTQCVQGPLDGFNFSWNCPTTFSIYDSKAIGQATVNVKSKDFSNVMMNLFIAEDVNMTLNFNGEHIYFKNKTKNYLTINSISFYQNNKIAQKENLRIELPPESNTLSNREVKIRDFPIDWSVLSFAGMTKKKATQHIIEFGFAVKYSIGDTNIEKTLYSTKKFKLYDLVCNL